MPDHDVTIKRFRAFEAISREESETILELTLGRRDLSIEVASTDLHRPSIRVRIFGPPPPPSAGTSYRRHEDIYVRSPEEFDAIVDAFARARARLRQLQQSLDDAPCGADGGEDE
jgi:hypothetical protein